MLFWAHFPQTTKYTIIFTITHHHDITQENRFITDWSCLMLDPQMFLQPELIPHREHGLSWPSWRPIRARDYKVCRSSYKASPVFFSDFKQNQVLINFTKISNMKFHKYLSSADRHDKAESHCSQLFCKCN